MKSKLTLAIAVLCLIGCASNPMMTGEPQHWVGRSASELEAGKGIPKRVVQQDDGSEVWEYVDEGEFVHEHESPGHYVNIFRYQLKNDKIKHWFWERTENGVVVRKDDGSWNGLKTFM